ncbi:unnamed protein product [Effrenium voratum]|uniref:Phospholipase D-like domain-containing protein n=1 Tax=Effrenium voratum TaxID=2562239 RepID=A0AA36I1D9_9DINO|nr:unnamed protein product [Effrenium voratum]
MKPKRLFGLWLAVALFLCQQWLAYDSPLCFSTTVSQPRRKLWKEWDKIQEVSGRQKTPKLQLLTGYQATVAAVMAELEACESGDEVIFSVYVVEPGRSSEALIAALAAAARRGVQLRLRTDCSVLSSFTRLCEGTTTLVHRLQQLRDEMPDSVVVEQPQIPTHAKLLTFRRKAASPDVAIFGGINFGDRFGSWRDFAMRLEGDAAVFDLLSSLRWRPTLVTSGVLTADTSRRALQFVTNQPMRWEWPAWLLSHPFQGNFDIAPEMTRFYSSFDSYRVAASYIDETGAAVLSKALERGARVELVMPWTPNVYADCNARTLGNLLGKWGAHGNFRLKLHSSMVHAKAAVAQGPSSNVALLGSCNLRQRSLEQFEELHAQVTDQTFCATLWKELGQLLQEGDEVQDPARLAFNPAMACLQDYFG